MSESLNAQQIAWLAQQTLEDQHHIEWQSNEVLTTQMRRYIHAQNKKELLAARQVLIQLLLARGATPSEESIPDETGTAFDATRLDIGAKEAIGAILKEAPDFNTQLEPTRDGRRRVPWTLERYGQFESFEPIPGITPRSKLMHIQPAILAGVQVYRGNPNFKEITNIQLLTRTVEPHR